MKLVYDGLRHNMFLKIKYGNNWLTALQATINMQQIFGTDINALRIGFTASNGNAYYDTDRIYSLRYRRAEINSAKSIVKENGTLKIQKRLCTMPGKFNKVVDLLALRIARSCAMAASSGVP